LAQVQATISALPFLSELIRRFLVEGCRLSVDAPETVRCRLAIQEAVANILRHAYRGREPGPIELELSRENDDVVVHLRDEGIPFDPCRALQNPSPSPLQLREGGYGMSIIAGVMTEIDYEHTALGNHLIMKKRMWWPGAGK
jgi:anti-sigma regulatory factor (Ser/Thr protein kinase)